MKYDRLGSSGLVISRVALGGSHFGSELDQEQVGGLVNRSLELGINTFYTSNLYGAGVAEERLGDCLFDKRDDVVIMTKVGNRVATNVSLGEMKAMQTKPGPDFERLRARGALPNSSGQSRKNILRAVEASLRRLRTDYIDVYQIHYWDPNVPIEETLSALSDLVHQGKVRYVGCSQTASWQLYRALWASEVGGFEHFQSVQVRYNVLDRDVQPGLLAAADAARVSVLAFGSLAAGVLTGKVVSQETATHVGSRQMYTDMYLSERNLELSRQFVAIAGHMGVDPATLAAAWVLSRKGVTSLLIGPNTVAELNTIAAAADFTVPADVLQEIDGLT